jgi:hypothetical protein
MNQYLHLSTTCEDQYLHLSTTCEESVFALVGNVRWIQWTTAADWKIPASGFDVIIATTIGRDEILPSGILVLRWPGWEYISEVLNYGFVDKSSRLLIRLINVPVKHKFFLRYASSPYTLLESHTPTCSTTHLGLLACNSLVGLLATHSVQPSFLCLTLKYLLISLSLLPSRRLLFLLPGSPQKPNGKTV